MKTKLLFTLPVIALSSVFTACEKENSNVELPEINVSGNVSGTWSKNTTVNVSGHITVPEGQTLTIEEGVQVIFDDNGVGVNHTGIEFMVHGKLYCQGTADNPVLFSVAESRRPAAVFAGTNRSRNCFP